MPNRNEPRRFEPPPKKRGKLFGGVIIFAVIVVVAAVAFLSPLLDLNTRYIYGNSTVRTDDIWEAAGLTARLERTNGLRPYPNFFSVSAARIERGILSLPYIYTAEVTKSFPNTITVRVTERTPAAYVLFQDMMFIYIDRHGMALEMRGYMPMNLPVITGLGVESFTPGQYLEVPDPASLAAAVTLTNKINERGMAVDRINTSDVHNIRLFADNMEILFGNMDEAEEKLIRLNAILTSPYREQGIRGTLDLSDTSGTHHGFSPLR